MLDRSRQLTKLAGLPLEQEHVSPRALALLWQKQYQNKASSETLAIIEFLLAMENQRYGANSSANKQLAIQKLQGQFKKIKWPKQLKTKF